MRSKRHLKETEWLKDVAGNYLTPKARDVYDQRLNVLHQKLGESEGYLTRN